ncbi:ABC transporter ATP-binding protein [Microbacterium sp. A196]|uniref:ABC transporter ATP-binding protein n=1 Tax=Microbacterium sp. A196 TaxID=3457320 RepID=UPI003FD4714F
MAARSTKPPAKTTTQTAAARATAAKSEESKAVATKKAAAAKSTAAKTTAAKTAAARSAEGKAQSATTAAKTTAEKATAAKTAATKAAATKAAATKAAATRAAKAEAAKKPLIAADDAAPTVEAVPSPAHEPARTDPATVDLHAVLDAEPVVEIEMLLEAKAAAEPASELAAEAEPVLEPEPEAAAEPVVADVVGDKAGEVQGDELEGAGNAIVVRGLVKYFGDQRAVNEINLTIPAGSFYGIVGPNGAGKTTTLSILAGLLRADSGQVSVCGIDQSEDALAAKRLMGVLPDRLRTFDRLTGRQLLHYYGLLRGLSVDAIEKRSADLVRAFDLSAAVGRVVSDYSAGMTKKIMLAGAMIHSPRVLVLDEPFESVDPVSSAVILDILRAYVAHGGTVVLSSHGMDLVERVCSRVAIIVGGDVLAEGTVDEVRAGQTLESRFVELSGGVGEVEGLEWLHTFSD